MRPPPGRTPRFRSKSTTDALAAGETPFAGHASWPAFRVCRAGAGPRRLPASRLYPWGRSPLLIEGFCDIVGEVLLKREPAGSLGARGYPPAALLPPFAAGDKRMWPRIRYPFQQRLCRAGTPFLFSKKGGKEAPRGAPLGTPRLLVDFLFMKIDSNAATRTGTNKKGAAAPRVGAAVFFQPCAQSVPGFPLVV